MTNVIIEYDADKRQFRIDAGMHQLKGREISVPIPAISEWLGWSRTVKGNYVAAAWPTSALSVANSPSVQVTWSPEAAMVRDCMLVDLKAAREALQLKKVDAALRLLLPTEREPRLHQWQAIHAMRAMDYRVLLADDMGLGKTATALWAAHDGKAPTIVVLCPVSVKFNWQREIQETLGNSWGTFVVDGGSKKRADTFAEVVHHLVTATNEGAGHSRKTAVIVNYDLLMHLTEEQLGRLQGLASAGMLICDESHYLKNQDSKRTQLSKLIASRAYYVACLTGTPIRNLADDLYSQVEIIRPGTFTSYRDFAKRHLVINAVKFGKRTVQKVVGVKNVDALNAIMNTMQIRRPKSEAIDLPPKIRTYPELELEGDLLRLYKAMKDFARIQLRELTQPANMDSLTSRHGVPLEKRDDQSSRAMSIFDPRAKSAVEQAMRCEQIAQGFIGGIPDPIMAALGADILRSAEKIGGRPNELIFPHAPKLVWLLEAIHSVLRQGGAPLVLTRFNAPMGWIAARLAADGVRTSILHGGLSPTEKDLAVAKFQHDRTADVLIAQVKMAEGWNAYRSQDVLFLGRDWSPAINAQGEDRAHRMGQTGTVNVQIPIVRRTIEVMIDRRLRAKDADANMALRTVTIQELMEAL